MLGVPPRKPVVEALVGIEMFFQRDHVYFDDFSGRLAFRSKEVLPVAEQHGFWLDEINDGGGTAGFDICAVHPK